jgi:hypothetical protein
MVGAVVADDFSDVYHDIRCFIWRQR